MALTELDKKIGIEKLPFNAEISGTIKTDPTDFIVQEIDLTGNVCSLDPTPTPTIHNSEYTIFTLVKRDWNQAIILKNIARKLSVSKKRLSFAGTKDKRALTSQRISAWRISPEQLSKIQIKDCKIGDFAASDKKLELGDLLGNRFTIAITNLQESKYLIEQKLRIFIREISNYGGFPNFFGEQRFGIRYNNHIIGRLLIKQDFEGALKEFLTGTSSGELEEGKNAREFLASNWGNFSGALKKFPRYARFEKAVLNHLVQYPNDYIGAFKKLPKNTYKLFTHAYQADIFNRELSFRIKQNIPLQENGNLVGYDLELSEFEKQLVERDNIKQADLRIKSFPEASVSGGKRAFLTKPENFSYHFNNNLMLAFDLEKGAYATAFLKHLLC